MGALTCLDCNSPFVRESYAPRGNPRRCPVCRESHRDYMKSTAQPAHLEVARAIRHGLLPKPSNFACADCKGPADRYDHRDYEQPLVVEPVCRSCNHKRGPAKRRRKAEVA